MWVFIKTTKNDDPFYDHDYEVCVSGQLILYTKMYGVESVSGNDLLYTGTLNPLILALVSRL